MNSEIPSAQIPCEFCARLFKAAGMKRHLASCKSKPTQVPAVEPIPTPEQEEEKKAQIVADLQRKICCGTMDRAAHCEEGTHTIDGCKHMRCADCHAAMRGFCNFCAEADWLKRAVETV